MKRMYSQFFAVLAGLSLFFGFAFFTSAATTYELTNVVTSGTNATISIAIHDGTPGTLYYIQAGEITSPGTCTLDPRYLSSGMTITPGTDAQKTATIIYPTPALSIGTTYCAGILTRANLASTTLVPLQLFPEKPFTITQTVVTAPATNPVANDCGAAGNGCYHLLAPLPGVGFNGNVSTGKDCVLSDGTVVTNGGLGCYAKSIIKLIIGLIGVLSVLMIVIGGIEYMSTVSGGEKNAAKGRITNAIFGLLLAVSSYVILNTLNPNLVALNITVPGVDLLLNLSYSTVAYPPGITPTAGSGLTTTNGATPTVKKINPGIDQYNLQMQKAALATGIDCTYGKAIMSVEDPSGKASIQSPVGAIGLMQLMPSTFQQYSTGSITDAQSNINAGFAYLAALKNKLACNNTTSNATGCTTSNLLYVSAAYNGGPGVNGPSDDCGPTSTKWMCAINRGGLQQTYNYAYQVMTNYAALKASGGGC